MVMLVLLYIRLFTSGSFQDFLCITGFEQTDYIVTWCSFFHALVEYQKLESFDILGSFKIKLGNFSNISSNPSFAPFL